MDPQAETTQLAGAADRRYKASPALFLSDAGGTARNRGWRLTVSGLYQALSRRSAAMGRKGCFGVHRLRHGLATLLVEANVSLALVSRWLGQSLETTTLLYAHRRAEAIHRHIGPIVAASLIEGGDQAGPIV